MFQKNKLGFFPSFLFMLLTIIPLKCIVYILKEIKKGV